MISIKSAKLAKYMDKKIA